MGAAARARNVLGQLRFYCDSDVIV
uniref:Uncharacterized protein n=1 Tax=Anguilla anguilla TaxID=7936 RepID=A0A0E9QS25_ANGAN